MDMAAALAAGAPLVHADKGTNRAFTWGFTAGDYKAAKRAADVVVSRRFVQQRVIPAAMEPRAVLAEPIPATRRVHALDVDVRCRTSSAILMSTMCGIPEQKLRVDRAGRWRGLRGQAQRLRRGGHRAGGRAPAGAAGEVDGVAR